MTWALSTLAMNRFFCFLCLVILVAGLGGNAGCSRQHYRAKADREVYSVLQQGNCDPRWKVDDYGIIPNAASRMGDPFHPDREPMPCDDPTAHRKMHNVAGMKGSHHWHDNGDTQYTENPCWRQYLLVNEKGEVPLDKDKAVELSIRHSPEYQSALENLYLSAMAVSRERFNYDVRFYGGDSVLASYSGDSSIRNSANVRAERRLATGGDWLIGLANSITWSLNNGTWQSSGSLLNVSVTQPLLRGAGRKVALESLTQSERNFLAAVRQMVLFRQGHYTRIVTGSSGRHTSAPSGSSGANTPSLGSGFYGLLEGQIQIQNQRRNMIGLEDNLDRLKEMFEAGQLENISQVEQTRQNLLMSQSNLLGQINTYQANIETYIRSLGLPPDLEISISDPLLEQFQLTSPTLSILLGDVNEFLAVMRKKDQPLPEHFRDEIKEIIRCTEVEMAIFNQDLEALQKSMSERLQSLQNLEALLSDRMASGERIEPSVYSTKIFEERIAELRSKRVPQNLDRLRAAFTLLNLIVNTEEPELREMIQYQSLSPEEKLLTQNPKPFSPEVLSALEELKLNKIVQTDSKTENEPTHQQEESEESTNELNTLKEALDAATPELSIQEARQRVVTRLRQKDEYRDWIRNVFSAFQYDLVSLSLNQTRTRLDAMTLIPISITAEEAFQAASEHRLDWMNQKSQLVDRWRQIDIRANQLKGALSLTFNGSAGTVDRNGVHFDGNNSSMNVGLAWDSPLTRYEEMMNYRSSQVAYQNARRNYCTYVDGVQAELRNIVRDVERSRIDFEIRRNQVLVDTVRVDIMQLQMERPPRRGGQIDTNTARDLIDAFNGLLRSQNDFLSTWIRYQTQRMLLDQNMGTMKLDDQGRWIDPGEVGSASASSPSSELAPTIPVPFIETSRLNRRYVD